MASKRKTTTGAAEAGAKVDQTVADVKRLAAELSDRAKDLKGKYDNLDEGTKKKIMAGVGGAIGILAGVFAASKIKAGRKKK
ncbi:MAG: hypothetical protein NUV82_04060 [Candidatus Komeilibacteria bacterium]|nr:hypothetical protein [Candidatus Komeilibacteria bacterium]